MDLSKKIRSKLLEILFIFSFESNEISNLSNYSLLEIIIPLISDSENLVLILASFDHSLLDFLELLEKYSLKLIQKNRDILKILEDFFLKILIIYPFSHLSIRKFYQSIRNQYNPFSDLFSQSDAGVLREKLKKIIIVLQFSSDNFLDLWDSSMFYDNLENLLKIKMLIAPTLTLLRHLLNFKEDFCVPDKKEDQKLFNEFQAEIDLCLNKILVLKEQIYKKKLINPNDKISWENIHCQNKKIKCVNESEEEHQNYIETLSDFEEMKEIRTKILLKDFIVIEGSTSSGKSTIIKQILKNKPNILVYLDSTTDLKSLIGAYVSSDKIGEFSFRYGPLTQAWIQGMFLILENFQEANEEIIVMLIKIMQNRCLDLTNQQEFLKMKAGFKIIAIANFDSHHLQAKKQMILNHVESYKKKILDFSYTQKVMELGYPKLFQSPILAILIKVQEILHHYQILQMKKSNISIQAENIRKWLILLKRIDFYRIKNLGDSGIVNNLITEDFRHTIFLEINDVFLCNDNESSNNLNLLQELAEALHLESLILKMSYFFSQYSPQIELSSTNVIIGRLGLLSRELFKNKENSINLGKEVLVHSQNKIIYNSYSSRLLEKIAICANSGEPCLLIGDTGCGKTTMIQHCAEIFRKKLWVYNMNPSSDAIDLIGGFKPLDIKVVLKYLLTKYIKRFEQIGNLKSNEKFLENLRNLLISKNYIVLMRCLLESSVPIKMKIQKKFKGNPEKLASLLKKWEKFANKIDNFLMNKEKIDSNLAFHYVEGSLITALKNGDWLLIDEINLANNEVLQRILPVLEGDSILLYDKGDLKTVKRHENFRIFACMNPGKDIGKKELPENVRAKFTDFVIDDISEKGDLFVFAERQIGHLFSKELCEKMVDLFLEFKYDIQNHLLESGSNRRLHISLRNLARTLKYILDNHHIYGLERCLYDGLYLGFASSLSKSGQESFQKILFDKFKISPLQYQNMLKSNLNFSKECLNLSGFIIKKGPLSLKNPSECNFLITPSFEKYLRDILRVISNTDLPLLLEGPTSSGKTSMIKYLAELLGYSCVRINNHEHTDVEEYLGSYQPNNKGKLIFMEGVLLQAMKNGSWLILDELNLARSEILESLNRLLDDNKELFIPELQKIVKPHPNFRIFATQNPSSYGGRKELSKAFRNRFIQLYFDEIGEEDLEQILQKRCLLPPSYTKKMLLIMKDLKVFRQRNNFFIGKEGVITIRDLLKWGGRRPASWEDLALEGYCLLAERLRNSDERIFIQEILEKHCKVRLHPQKIYETFCQKHLVENLLDSPLFIQMNPSFIRMAALTMKALQGKEPVLLIGETGCGKTTLCQLLAFLRKAPFFSLNCHKFTESSDFIGSLRPIRNRQETILEFNKMISELSIQHKELSEFFNNEEILLDEKLKKLDESNLIIDEEFLKDLKSNLIKQEMLFEWQDGPLIEAMQKGGVFLIDEISLAEDSVLERLNSVLEPEKRILIPEKGGVKIEEIQANDAFIIVATMNPGGDFGKRELSAALRNRFTEIWVESLLNKKFLGTITLSDKNNSNLVYQMIKENLQKRILDEDCSNLAWNIYEFVEIINGKLCEGLGLETKGLSMRDVIGMIDFIENTRKMLPNSDIICFQTFQMMIQNVVGFLGLGENERNILNNELNSYLNEKYQKSSIDNAALKLEYTENMNFFGIAPFYIPVNANINKENFLEIKDGIKFSIKSPMVLKNLYNLLRSLQVNKAIMLEGPPGVGKSSLIEYLAEKSGKKLLRITLTEQTDIIDLLGSDFPADSSELQGSEQEKSLKKGRFKWYDGIILDALRNGHWLLLEELNLANQSILEGLNAILDHRGSVFVPEINKTFEKHMDFRLFTTQCPINLGGGRKGLPVSFLNRFNKHFIEDFSTFDLLEILKDCFPKIDVEFVKKVLTFASEIKQDYECKLNDFLRFFEIKEKKNFYYAFEMIFLINERTAERKEKIIDIASKLLGDDFFNQFFSEYENNRISLKEQCNLPLIKNIEGKPLVLLNKFKEIINFFKIGLELGYPLMIIGSDGSGKKSLTRIFAEIFEREIEEVTLSPSTDINELIGSYEQISVFSEIKRLGKDLLSLMKEKLTFHENVSFDVFQRKVQIYREIENLLFADIDKNEIMESNYVKFIEKIEDFKGSLIKENQDITTINEISIIITQKIQQFLNNKSSNSGAFFQWIPSKVVEAMRKGKWLVLDNLAMMNPAIFSRLNPLLKGKGSLYISESHDSNGQPLLQAAHPDFRLILLWNLDQANLNSWLASMCLKINVDYELNLNMNDCNINEEGKNSLDFLHKNMFFSDLKLIYRYEFNGAFSEETGENETIFIKILTLINEFYLKAMALKFHHYFSGNLRSFTRFLDDLKARIMLKDNDLTFEDILKNSFLKIYNSLASKYGLAYNDLLEICENAMRNFEKEKERIIQRSFPTSFHLFPDYFSILSLQKGYNEHLLRNLKSRFFNQYKEFLMLFSSKNCSYFNRKLLLMAEDQIWKTNSSEIQSFVDKFQVVCFENLDEKNEITRQKLFQNIIESFFKLLNDIAFKTSNPSILIELDSLKNLIFKLWKNVSQPQIKLSKLCSKIVYSKSFLINRLSDQKIRLLIQIFEGHLNKNETNLSQCSNDFNLALWKIMEFYEFQANSSEKCQLQKKILFYLYGDTEAEILEFSNNQFNFSEETGEIRKKFQFLYWNNKFFRSDSLKCLSALYFPSKQIESSKNVCELEKNLLCSFESETIRLFSVESQKATDYSLQILDETVKNEILREVRIIQNEDAKTFWEGKLRNQEEWKPFSDLLRKMESLEKISLVSTDKKNLNEALKKLLEDNNDSECFSNIMISHLLILNEEKRKNWLMVLRIILEVEDFKIPQQKLPKIVEYLKNTSFMDFSLFEIFNQKIQKKISNYLEYFEPKDQHLDFSHESKETIVWILGKIIDVFFKEKIGHIPLNSNSINEIIELMLESKANIKEPEILSFLENLKDLITQNEKNKESNFGNLALGFFLYKNFAFYSTKATESSSKSQGMYRLLWNEIDYGIKNKHYQEESEFKFAEFHLQRLFFEFVDCSSNDSDIAKLIKKKKKLIELKKHLIFRDSENSLQTFDFFLSYLEEDLKEIDQILEFLNEKGFFSSNSLENIQLNREYQAIIDVFIKKSQNFIVNSFDRFFLSFQDVLLPFYLSLSTLMKGFSNLIPKDSSINNCNEMLTINNPKNIDEILLVLDKIETNQTNDPILMKKLMNTIYDLIHNIFIEHELEQEESLHKKGLKIANDRTSRYKILTEEFQQKIRDEYTSEAVEEEKKMLESEVNAEFNYFIGDFSWVLSSELKLKEKTLTLNENSSKNMLPKETQYEKMLDLLHNFIHFQLIFIYKRSNFLNKNENFLKNSINEIYVPWKKISYIRDFKPELLYFTKDFPLLDSKISKEFLQFSTYVGNFVDKFKKNHSKEKTKTLINIYDDINPLETQIIIIPVTDVLVKAKFLLSQEIFENNALLQNIVLLCDYMLGNSLLQTPLSKILTGVQFLVEKLEEWNTMVPKAYEMSIEKEKLLEILLKWRKMERNGWKILLMRKEYEVEKKDVEIFWNLLKTLQDINPIEKECNELFGLLDNFLNKSKVGCFIQRLRMLALLIELGNHKKPVLRIMKQIKGFYSQYIQNFMNRKENMRKALEKEIKEYEELAGWKSKNYLILKDTCEKFRKKINRISRRYIEILESPIDQFLLETTRNSLLHDSLESFIEFLKINYFHKKEVGSSKAFFQCKALNNHDLPKKAHNILKKCSLALPMHYYYEENPCKVLKIEENDNNPTSYGYLDGIIETIFNRITDLKKENVTKLMKFRALQDLYKILKEMGLTSLYKTYSTVELSYEFDLFNLNHDIFDENVEIPPISDEHPLIERFLKKIHEETNYKDKLHEFQGKILEKIEGYYYKILDRMSVLRIKNEFHNDIALLHIRKGIGFIIEMFYTFRSHYKQFFNMLQGCGKINQFMTFFLKIKDLSERENELAIHHSSIPKNLLEKCIDFFNRSSDLCNENKDLFIEKNEFLVKNEEILKKLAEGKMVIERIMAGHIGKSKKNLFIFSGDLDQLLNKLKEISLMMENLINGEMKKIPESKLRVLISEKFRKIQHENNNLFDLLNEFLQHSKSSSQNSQNQSNFDLIHDKNIAKNIEVCQLLTQSISRLFSDYKIKIDSFYSDDNQNQEIPLSTTSFLSNEFELNGKYLSISKGILKETEHIYSTYFSNISIISFQALKNSPNLISLISLITLLGKFHKFAVDYNAKFLKSFGKLSSLISLILTNLFYKGFCHAKPENGPQDNQENDENTEFIEGTGIGEGQGQENISKEIEYEEQVLGTKNEENPLEKEDQNEKVEKPKEEEGIDMENDFEGENVSEDEKNPDEDEENDQEKEDKENQEKDEEFSNVDKDLDYDLWNKDEMEQSEGDKEEEKPQRELEDLELKADQIPENAPTESRAKKDREKEKENQRNLKEFDQDEDDLKKEMNELESLEEDEEEMKEIEDEQNPRMGDPLQENEMDKNDEKMSLEFGEDERKEEEISEGGISQEENEENLNDPLEQKEQKEIEEEFNEDKENQGEDDNQEKNSHLNEEMELENEAEESEENEKNDDEMTSGLQSKENKEKAFGKKDLMTGNQDVIDEEDMMNKEKGQGKGEEGGKDLAEKILQNQESSGFSQEFLKAFIEHTSQIYDEKQMETFMKDLNVVNESEKDKKKDSGKEKKEMNKMMEFEATEKQGENDQGFITNLPNIQENENKMDPKLFNEELDKNEKKTDFSKSGKENFEEKESTLEEEKNDILKTQGKSKKKEQMSEEPAKIEFKSQKTGDKNELKGEKIKPETMEIEKPEEEVPNLLNLMNSKKTQEERKSEIFELIKEWKNNLPDYEKSMKLWNEIEVNARHHSIHLCEELKSVLEPNEVASFKGDYKSGKRINMKKIIPYIASNFKKDKIWLRRNNPSKRKYQVYY